MGRHPPKNLSQALMARILMWREQVAEVGDLSPRARAILCSKNDWPKRASCCVRRGGGWKRGTAEMV